MKKALIAVAALLGMSGIASAADMAVKARPMAPVAPACANFGGVYVGAHGTATVQNSKWTDLSAWRSPFDGDLASSLSSNDTGYGDGVQAGWNWQRNCTVFGVEADWTWVSLNSSATATEGTGAGADVITVNSDLKWYGTVRTRAGIVVNDLLLYTTGGLFYAKQDWSWFGCCSGAAPLGSELQSYNKVRWGWTVGVGTEWAFANNWSLKSEVLYAQLPDNELAFFSPENFAIGNSGTQRVQLESSFWIARLGVNYRFGGGLVP
jgi:outer membrane immunogenic protein